MHQCRLLQYVLLEKGLFAFNLPRSNFPPPFCGFGSPSSFIIIIIYPLTTRVVGDHRWFRNQFPPFPPVLHCPLGLDELQACPFPNVVFPPLPLSALTSSPFHCAVQDGFGQTWWTGDMTIPLSLRLFTVVGRSSCGPIACWILAWTSSLVTWSLYEMVVSCGSTSFPWLVFLFWALLYVRVRDSQAYRKIDVTIKGAHQAYLGTERNTCVIPLLPIP